MPSRARVFGLHRSGQEDDGGIRTSDFFCFVRANHSGLTWIVWQNSDEPHGAPKYPLFRRVSYAWITGPKNVFHTVRTKCNRSYAGSVVPGGEGGGVAWHGQAGIFYRRNMPKSSRCLPYNTHYKTSPRAIFKAVFSTKERVQPPSDASIYTWNYLDETEGYASQR